MPEFQEFRDFIDSINTDSLSDKDRATLARMQEQSKKIEALLNSFVGEISPYKAINQPLPPDVKLMLSLKFGMAKAMLGSKDDPSNNDDV